MWTRTKSFLSFLWFYDFLKIREFLWSLFGCLCPSKVPISGFMWIISVQKDFFNCLQRSGNFILTFYVSSFYNFQFHLCHLVNQANLFYLSLMIIKTRLTLKKPNTFSYCARVYPYERQCISLCNLFCLTFNLLIFNITYHQ